MVNEWHQYSTDDEGGGGGGGEDGTGNGDVLVDYSFEDFHKLDTFWTSLLFAPGFMALVYVGLLPPVSRLVCVADADASNVTTVLSRHGTTGLGRVSSVAAVLRGESGKADKSGAKHRRAADPSLRTNLIDGDRQEETRVVEDPPLVYDPGLTVESFRLSSGVVQRAQGSRLVLQDVHYTVPDRTDNSKELPLLKGVTGRAMPGEMVALMGASGASRSTLLDVLAQRKNTDTITGTISYNRSSEMTSSAYVMQDNVHMGVLTVRESFH